MCVRSEEGRILLLGFGALSRPVPVARNMVHIFPKLAGPVNCWQLFQGRAFL